MLKTNILQKPMTNLHTNSTAWPEIKIEAGASATALALLDNLESTLVASRQALLARDVVRLEQLTDEQAQLLRELAKLLALGVGPHPDGPLAGASAAIILEPARQAAQRVLRLARIQHVLLERAQRSLRVLSHCLAGPQALFEPASRALVHYSPAAPSVSEDPDLCRH